LRVWQHSDFNSELKLSARTAAADLPTAIDRALRRLMPELCAPLLDETAKTLRHVLAIGGGGWDAEKRGNREREIDRWIDTDRDGRRVSK
jgi:hypothetical protein